MWTRFAVAASAAAVLTATPLAAQSVSTISVPRTQAVLELAPYAGYMMSEDLWSGPLGTRLSIGGGVMYGGQATLALYPGFGVVGNVAYMTSDLEVGAPILGGLGVGESTALFYDGAIQIGAVGGSSRAVAPFLQLGAGGARRELGVAGFSAESTDFVWVVGAGVDLSLLPNLGVRVLARDYIGEIDFGDGFVVDLKSERMHNVGLSAGLRFSF